MRRRFQGWDDDGATIQFAGAYVSKTYNFDFAENIDSATNCGGRYNAVYVLLLSLIHILKAVMAVREGAADAVVSAGSTGALLAGGMLRIGRIRGIERPALAPVIPGRKKPFLLIDCGANVDCQARYLQQFGLMGSVYMQSVQGVEQPEVGLANIGAEAEKGDKLTREAYALMSSQTAYVFKGNAEVRDAPNGDFDVVVADGFVGNVILKTIEGVAGLIMGMLKDGMRS